MMMATLRACTAPGPIAHSMSTRHRTWWWPATGMLARRRACTNKDPHDLVAWRAVAPCVTASRATAPHTARRPRRLILRNSNAHELAAAIVPTVRAGLCDVVAGASHTASSTDRARTHTTATPCAATAAAIPAPVHRPLQTPHACVHDLLHVAHRRGATSCARANAVVGPCDGGSSLSVARRHHGPAASLLVAWAGLCVARGIALAETLFVQARLYVVLDSKPLSGKAALSH